MNPFRRFISGVTKKFLSYTGVYESSAEKKRKWKENGLVIGKNVIIDSRAHIDNTYSFLISIGDNSIIAANVSILAHDSTIFPHTKGHGRIEKVVIKENCIISAGSMIMPGVTIGPNVLVGAGSVVNKDIPPNSCVAGVPARYYSSFDDMIKRHMEKIKTGTVIDYFEIFKDEQIADVLKQRIIEGTRNGPVYISNLDKIGDI